MLPAEAIIGFLVGTGSRDIAVTFADIGKPPIDRYWRRTVARQQGVPAFVVMHDSSLEELCRKRPGSIPELLRISGFGERKAALYGPQLFEALKRFREGGLDEAPAVEKSASPGGSVQMACMWSDSTTKASISKGYLWHVLATASRSDSI